MLRISRKAGQFCCVSHKLCERILGCTLCKEELALAAGPEIVIISARISQAPPCYLWCHFHSCCIHGTFWTIACMEMHSVQFVLWWLEGDAGEKLAHRQATNASVSSFHINDVEVPAKVDELMCHVLRRCVNLLMSDGFQREPLLILLYFLLVAMLSKWLLLQHAFRQMMSKNSNAANGAAGLWSQLERTKWFMLPV